MCQVALPQSLARLERFTGWAAVLTVCIHSISWSQLDSKISGRALVGGEQGMLELVIFIVAYFVLVNVVLPRFGIRPG